MSVAEEAGSQGGVIIDARSCRDLVCVPTHVKNYCEAQEVA